MASKRKKHRHLPVIIVGVAVVGVAGGAFALVRSFLNSSASPPKQVVQQIQLIRPPPPPPDLPPPPPPPPEEKVAVVEPEKQPDPAQSNDPPPGQQLGLDAEGGAGGDAFGLIGNKGGRELTATGGSAFAWYAGLLKNQILDQLSEDKRVRSGNYRLTVRAWVGEDGSVQRMEIIKGSGDTQRDHAIEGDLSHVKRVPQARPAGMPDIISFEVVARG
jgi:periplasmic protein TonB